MQTFKKLAFIMLMGIVFMGTALAQPSHVLSQKKEGNVSYLFIDVAEHGSLQKNPDGETYALTLHDADDWVTYFSDVPHRVTGILTVEDFAKLLNKETASKHTKGLNAGLVAVDAQSNQKVRYILSLSNLSYDAKKTTLVFTARVIPGEQKLPIPDAAKFHHVSLFIDSIHFDKTNGYCASCAGPL